MERQATSIVTLRGYLGQDPAVRTTKPRTYTRQPKVQFVFEHAGRSVREEHDLLPEIAQEIEIQPREYVVLSLATHRWIRGERRTTWHRVVAWNTDHQHFGIRRFRKGYQVEITGRTTQFEIDGRAIAQIELTDLRLISTPVTRGKRPFVAKAVSPGRNHTSPNSSFIFKTHDGRAIPLTGAPIIA